MDVRDSAATIKFFNANNGSSESDSDSEKQPDSKVRQESKDSQEFHSSDFDADEERDRDVSIYDTPSSLPDYSMSLRLKDRTDSDSNLLVEDHADVGDELVLDVAEDHFGLPEDLTRIRDINCEIEKIKLSIFQTPDSNPDKGKLIERLISLRLRKSELESQTADGASFHLEAKVMYGHEFHLREVMQEGERFCEVCCNIVWGVIHSWYACALCSICCHDKCLNSLKRMCASKKVAENAGYIAAICPDKGLPAQNYKCYECQTPISYKSGSTEPRQCDYTGNYYCPSCHWNDESVIPARVMHNWDFDPRPVCRASKQYLRLMYKRPVITFNTTYSYLLKFVQELNEMKKLREEILMMKKYFLSCQNAMQSKLLLQLSDRQHFVENCEQYSMNDLVELVHERLLPVIVRVHANYASHIKVECTTCRGKGYYCEVCNLAEVIFAFDNICVSCPDCSNVFHKYCFMKVQNTCPRCERKRKRVEEHERKAQLLKQIEESSSS